MDAAPSDEPHRLPAVGMRTSPTLQHADSPNVTVDMKADGGKQVQRLGSHRAGRDPFKWSPRAVTRDHPKSPGVEVVARCGWCDARRVEDLQVLSRDVAGEAGS